VSTGGAGAGGRKEKAREGGNYERLGHPDLQLQPRPDWTPASARQKAVAWLIVSAAACKRSGSGEGASPRLSLALCDCGGSDRHADEIDLSLSWAVSH
jgi:hypothetical protein